MKKPTKRSDCPISYFADFFGDKWTLLVLRDIVMGGKRHFKDIQKSDEHIATNILSDRLNRLEDTGWITKTIDPYKKNQYIYSATECCRGLTSVFVEIAKWSCGHDEQSIVPKMAADSGYANADTFIEETITSSIDSNLVKPRKNKTSK